MRDLLGRIADSDATILITGETGTGKELAARALHRLGRRRAGPFVAVNCAALPEPLVESELFGHARGAFTDARMARTGLFVQASGGTLLLDDIGDMPLGIQPKLLRALQERAVRPVGGDSEVPVDVRVVTTSNRDLHAAIEEGRFRPDLYFRVSVIQVELEEVERRHILRVMDAVGGNKTLAARVLRLGRKTLYRKLAAYRRTTTLRTTSSRGARTS